MRSSLKSTLVLPSLLALASLDTTASAEEHLVRVHETPTLGGEICTADAPEGETNQTPIPDQPLLAEVDGRWLPVDQIIDMKASTPQDMFRFEPNFMMIQPGDTINFQNSLGAHSVTLIRGMAPEGTENFIIQNRKDGPVKFDKPGIYGIRCKVHYRYGMVALVVVGDQLDNLDKARAKKHSSFARARFKELWERFDKEYGVDG